MGLAITGYIVAKKKDKTQPFNVPEPKFLHLLGIWAIFYLVALSIEWIGHLAGFWTWFNTNYIFLHAAYWWATLLTVGIFFLSALKPLIRYGILLTWVLLFEYLQEALIHWVTHFPLLGSPYLMITIVMCVVCSASFKALDIIVKLKLLKKD